jgi:hypothetical protein
MASPPALPGQLHGEHGPWRTRSDRCSGSRTDTHISSSPRERLGLTPRVIGGILGRDGALGAMTHRRAGM